MIQSQNLSPARRLLRDILANVGIESADGRPLYQYKVSDEQYKRGRTLVANYMVFLEEANISLCALFVLMTSEWFRREATSVWREWRYIGLWRDNESPQRRNLIASKGLSYWKIDTLINYGEERNRREFLLTIALNAGLPSNLLLGETGNKVRTFFETMMKDALETNNSTFKYNKCLAQKNSAILPHSYQQEIIFELSAELISKLTQYYLKIPDLFRQTEPVVWLDKNESGWRDELPIYLPDNDDVCNRLFNALLKVKIQPKSQTIGIRRQLQLTEAGWQEGFDYDADGELTIDVLTNIEEGRFKAFFAGSVKRLISREFALVYTTTNDDGTFSMSSKPAHKTGFIGPVPFSESITVDLVQEKTMLPSVMWPKGRAWNSNCYVLKETTKKDRLELVASGSFLSELDVVYLLVPIEAIIEVHNDGDYEKIWSGDNKCLYLITGQAIVKIGDFEKYRIQTGSNEKKYGQFEIKVCYLPDISLEKKDIFPVASLNDVSFGEMGKSVVLNKNITYYGNGSHHRLEHSIRGIRTIVYKDGEGFLIDKAKLWILPKGFSLNAKHTKTDIIIEAHGLDGLSLELLGNNDYAIPYYKKKEGSYYYKQGQIISSQQKLKITDISGQNLTLRVKTEMEQLVIVDADDRIYAEPPTLSLADLRGKAFISHKKNTLDLILKNAGLNGEVTRDIIGDVPFSRFYDLIEGLLGLAKEADPCVQIRNNQQDIICTINRPKDAPLIIEKKIKFFGAVPNDAIAVIRPFSALEKEYSLKQEDGHYQVPEHVIGSGIVYMRLGDVVLTRPKIFVKPLNDINAGNLVRIMQEDDEFKRETALNNYLDSASLDEDEDLINEIITTIDSLCGLSPRALDILRYLPNHPQLLCRIILSTTEEKFDTVLNLERGLPFFWMALPLEDWQKAGELVWSNLTKKLEMVFPKEQAQSHAIEVIVQRFNNFSEHASWFAGIQRILALPVSRELLPLLNVAQGHVLRCADHIYGMEVQLVELAQRIGLPREISNLNFRRHKILVAPVLLAALSLKQIPMTEALAVGLRDAMDIDQDYIASAFPHCLDFLRGKNASV